MIHCYTCCICNTRDLASMMIKTANGLAHKTCIDLSIESFREKYTGGKY